MDRIFKPLFLWPEPYRRGGRVVNSITAWWKIQSCFGRRGQPSGQTCELS